MEAFIDESGIPKGSPSFSVAAVVGAHWQWRKFLSYWSVVSVVDSNAGFNVSMSTKGELPILEVWTVREAPRNCGKRTSFGSQSDQWIDTGSATGG